MTFPATPSALKQIAELNNLAREFGYYAKGVKIMKNSKAMKSSFKALEDGILTVNKRIKPIETTANKASKITDFLQKGLFKEINPKWGARLLLWLDVLNLGISTFIIKKNEEIQELNIQSQKITEAGLSDTFTRTINNSIKIRNIEERIKTQENDFKEEILKQEVQNNFFKKQFNDLTYEVRKGREKVELRLNEQISNFNKFKNDITYEVREGRKKVEAQLKETVVNTNKIITDVRNQFNTQKQELQKQVDNAVKTAKSAIDNAKGIVDRVKGVESQQLKDYQKLQSSINNIEKGSIGAIQSKLADFQKQINQQGFLSREIQAKIDQEIAKALQNADATTARTLQAFKTELNTQITRVESDKDKIKSDIQKLLLNKNKSDLLEQKFIDLEVANKKSSDILNNLVNTFTNSTNQRINTLDNRMNGLEQNSQAKFGAINSKVAELQKQISQQGYFSEEVRANLFKEIDKIVSESGDKNLLQLKTEIDKKLLPFYREQAQLKQDIQKILLDKNKTDELREKTIALEKSYAESQKVLDEVLNTSSNLQTQVKQIERSDTNQNNQIQKIDNKVKELDKKRQEDFTLVTKINDRVAAIDRYSQDTRFIVTRVNDEIVNVKQNINGQLKDIDRKTFEKLKPEIKRETKAQITTIIQPQIEQLKQADRGLDNRLKTTEKQADDIERQLEKTIKPEIKKLDTKIKERENVDKEANDKLSQIIGLVGLIPGIPARTSGFITPKIPTPAQITQATGTAICNSLNGGCAGKAVNQINNNTNSQAGNILNGLNLGANAAQLTLLNTINNKLGAQLPGGLAGKLNRFTQWLQLDRALNILIFAATVQNHLMLSNDIGQTLIGALSNVLQIIGLKDDNGNPFDLGSIINSTIENLVKGIVGAENYQIISEAWAKANRIYQATQNVLNSFLNLSQIILQANELIAGYTGKIGNALKKGGVVLENAYGWMNPQPKFNRVTQFLEGLQNGASTIQMVTQVPLDIANATTELTNASTEFVKAIKEDGKPENQSEEKPEPEALKAKEGLGKTNSQPQPFDFSDLFDGEDS